MFSIKIYNNNNFVQDEVVGYKIQPYHIMIRKIVQKCTGRLNYFRDSSFKNTFDISFTVPEI